MPNEICSYDDPKGELTMKLMIRGGRIHDAIREEAYISDIYIEDGVIRTIGKDLKMTEDCSVYDASGKDLWPGLIDAHTHTGMFGHSGTSNKDDVEKYEHCVPENRIIDAVNPMEDSFRRALRGGVTCVCVTPGSVNCMGGTALAMKTYGRRIDDMVVKNPVAMKIAFGENPKDKLQKKLTTRMTAVAAIRGELDKAIVYLERKERGEAVAYDAGCEALIPVLKKQIPLKAHAHRSSDIFSAIRLAKEYDLLLTLEHVTEGGGIADILAKEGYPIVAGPFVSQPQKEENQNGHPSVAVALAKAGCQVSVMTDSPIVSEEYLRICAALLVREGLTEFEALQSVTVNPAKHLGIRHRVGALEEGLDADIVVTDGSILDIFVRPEAVFVNGERITL